MRTAPWIALALFLLAVPQGLLGQGFAIGARAGTLGLGGEAALGLSDFIAIRGGYGVFPYEVDGTFDGNDYNVKFPSNIWTIGVDLYPGGGGVRLMAGLMGRTGDVEVEAPFTGSREIGGTTYTSSGTLKGVLAQKATAPFVGLGFGRHTSAGFGFFLDLGVALTGDPTVTVTASGPIASVPGIQTDLQKEADNIKDDAGSYLKYWPMLSLGVKIPFGG